ncbi:MULTISPECIES: response regulator [Paenibacillus]|uniref:Circadian input-output histidine kinase CikA n=1 Tax=Paenibacillus polymyxa TaxID=1406 RepID=A0A8I1IVH4_PAEPO|nr:MULTISPECIES: response regulator [Paenibacillus]KAF6571285.1 response regulator [Paenibacillus sp. EKM206P]KAF6586286.1 response regulator [Paenibacillus sp. EKM205P]MBM0635413.1 response regulator [Paenibacillus polymyxa]UMY54069.1 response regulator [Paenibacillus peoriae]
MKIRNKLLIGFGSLMAILLVLTLISYDRMGSLNEQLNQVYQDRYMKVRKTTAIRGQVNDMAKVMANLILNPGSSVSEAKRELDDISATGTKVLASLQTNSGTSEEQQQVDRVAVAWNEFLSYEQRLVSLLGQDRIDEANAFRNSTGLPAQEEAMDSINALAVFQDREIDSDMKQANLAYEESVQITTILMAAGLIMGLLVILWVLPSIAKGLNVVNLMINGFGKGKYRAISRMSVASKDEIGEVARVFQQMAGDLEEKRKFEHSVLQTQKDQTWLNANTARVTELFRGVNSLEQVAQMFISEFTPILGGSYGAIYLQGKDVEDNRFKLYGSYAKVTGENSIRDVIQVGEGLLGQCVLDRKPILITEAPDGYLSIGSALGESKPVGIMIFPILFEDECIGAIEIASLDRFSDLETKLFAQLVESMGIILNNIKGRMRVEQLLRESQALTEELQCQSEELQTQQEELKRSNENLEEQTEELKRSEELLQRQQEELEHFNTELIAKTRALEEQVREVEEKNDEIEHARAQLEQQAMQLGITSKYKSEFLANMSHELRTPLNSLLILSQLLSENKEGNLKPKQVEYAQTIYMSGADLLKMIDEILDLSKVDAGKMDINHEAVHLKELELFVEQNFAPVAAQRGLQLHTEIEENLPDAIISDGYRLKQILRNLLSNAFKFTTEGSIRFSVSRANGEQLPGLLNPRRSYLALSVHDTGIGIASDKTDLIFEAFQQVDGTTSRKYGGTGLGLSISRELSRLLGGVITVESEQGQGSCFTLYLPEQTPTAEDMDSHSREEFNGTDVNSNFENVAASAETDLPMIMPAKQLPLYQIPSKNKAEDIIHPGDDRNEITSQDKVLLIIEDDINFANILYDMARSRGFKALIALQGDDGLNMAQSYLPDAIILDIQLPVMDGWSILGELKGNSSTRHIPVHVISVIDDVKQGLMMGAIAYLKKPSSKESLDKAFSHIKSYTDQMVKRLLVVEDDDNQRKSIIELIDHDDVAITAVSTGQEALNELATQRYDCMVLDLMLSDMTGFELLDRIRENEQLADLPIIIYTGKDLDNKEETQLRKYAESIIIKDVKSPERLLDETTLFLHRVEANLPEDKRKILQKLYNKEELFEGKKILLVDDDIRNVFALSSVLESYRMDVTFAENGREALELLEQTPDFDLVLMDMMMPEMDGYEAMRRIRLMPQFEKMPIIALTAKAMKDDRSKCIEAGASDYVKKPIQTEQLLSLMRVWLYS